jgi:HAD superfamily hydrolase (TIGR01509 family)
MIEAVIFDMDGLLIDSEPLWRAAEKEVFSHVGITLTDDMCEQTVGLRINEVVQFWHSQYPWNNRTLDEVEHDVVQQLTQLIKDIGAPLPGVNYILGYFQQKGLRIALASSSNLNIIEMVLEKLEIGSYFEVVHSAQFEDYGKPHPAVFLTAAKQLKVEPTQCLVFEDSFNGIISAKAARMKTVAIPETIHRGKPKFNIADVLLNSLEEFNDGHLNTLNN